MTVANKKHAQDFSRIDKKKNITIVDIYAYINTMAKFSIQFLPGFNVIKFSAKGKFTAKQNCTLGLVCFPYRA